MKKFISLFILITLLLLPTRVFAVEFTIDETDIHASLKTDGKVEVKETHTYNFEGEFNGITRTLIPKEKAAITDVRAAENGTDLKIEKEDELYKIYRGGSDETVTIDLFYTIEDGMEVYEDIAQFYWPFFDKNNESTYEDLMITIKPPQSSDVKAAYGYDEAYDTVTISDNGTVTFKLGKVLNGKNGDIRVAYPASLFPEAAVTSFEPMLDEVIAEKRAVDEEAAARAEATAQWGILGPYIILPLTLVALGLAVHGLRKRKETMREVRRQRSGFGRFPKEKMSLPAMMKFTNYGHLPTTALTSALLDLVHKGNIEQISEKEFRVSNRDTVYAHERLLIDWLFDEIAQQEMFHVDDIERYAEKEENQEKYSQRFDAWKEMVNQEYRQYDLHETAATPRWISGFGALVTLPFVVLFPFYGQFIWMAASIVLLVFFITYSIAYRPLNIKGQKIKQELQPLKTGDQWKTWAKEDQVPALLYQIGIGKRDLLATPAPLHTSTTDDWVIFLILGASLQNCFHSAEQHTSVSASTGSGGAGVGGGGGGSGAF
ncbi:DUF2207 domain-containing protein [Halobacillus litoralis]|nr:DUF2207 domain-containing protein [Halobacillus litoralis]